MIDCAQAKEKSMKLIDELIKDNMLKNSLKKFFYSLNFEDYSKAPSLYSFIRGINLFLIYFSNNSYTNLNWNLLCEISHEFRFRDRKYSTGYHFVRQLTEAYFIYLLKYEYMNTKELSSLKVYENLIQDGFCYKIQEYKDILPEYIQTHYPLNSSPNEIFQYNFIDKSQDNKFRTTNINLHTKNVFLYDLLMLFIKHISEESYNKPVRIHYRTFFFFFEQSFGIIDLPKNINDFSLKTFDIQYSFYKEKESLLKDISVKIQLRRILANFYSFLDKHSKKYNICSNLFSNTFLSSSVLENSNFIHNYENGFKYIIYNRLNDYPKEDKWWLNPGKDSDMSVNSRSTNCATVDLTQIADVSIRNDIKEWLWYGNGLIATRSWRYESLVYLMNFRTEYENEQKSYLRKSDNSVFSFELIWFYLVHLDSIYDNLYTKRNITNTVKSFLKYHRSKYKVDEKTLKLLRFEYKHSEGTPIIKKDLDILINEFRILSNTHKYGKLLFNIFILCVTTNMRIGEILNLERNCIEDVDEKGNGTINLKRKTSHGEYLQREYDSETIQLINISKELTEEFVDRADTSLKKYIFISEGLRKDSIVKITSEFNRQFYNIVRKPDLNLDKIYRPYDLRHTFINAIYDDGIKNDINIIKLQQRTDNTFNTVMNHYRKKLEVKDYVEILSKTMITNVDIEGTILTTDEEMINSNPVLNELGGCKENDCISDNAMCLTCPHFLTCLSRIPMFEKMVIFYREKLDSMKADFPERKEYQANLELYATYLAKMLEMKKKSKGGRN